MAPAHWPFTARKSRTPPGETVFRGSDYGGCINLEGDVAGYVIAQEPVLEAEPSEPVIPEGKAFADMLESYLSPGAPSLHWKRRARRFLKMLGARFDSSSLLVDEARFIASLAEQIEDFGAWYLGLRLKDKGNADPRLIRAAARHLPGTAAQVAEVFIRLLVRVHLCPELPLTARPPFPKQPPPGTENPILGRFADGLEGASSLERRAEEELGRAKGFLGELFGN